jgi:FeS assembly SUF system regulator
MLKLNKLADYATVVLSTMAAAPADRHNGQSLSERTQIPAPTVAKLLKALTRGGLVHSSRGLHGGYRLARAPSEISVADVVRALEGPIAFTDCATHGSGCGLARGCRSRSSFRLIDAAIQQALEAVTLDQMARPVATEVPVLFHPPAGRRALSARPSS